jgi:hypothetical protein
MPQPNVADLHVDALLTMLSIAYMNEPDAYIADQVFPIVGVGKQSNKIAKYDKEFWFRDEAKLRAPATESYGSGYEVDTSDTYYCDNYAFHIDVPDEERANYDSPFDPDNDATRLVVEKLRLIREVKFAADFFVTSVWQGGAAGHDLSAASHYQWDDYANSDPLADVEVAREAIYSSTGKDMNKAVWGRAVWSKLKHHPDLIERIKYTQKAILTVDLVAALMEIPKIYVGKAIKAATVEGQTATYSYVFGKNALFLYTPDSPGLRVPSAGYTFHWNKFGGISYMRRVRDDKAQYDRIEGHTFFDQKAIGTDLGYIHLNVVG